MALIETFREQLVAERGRSRLTRPSGPGGRKHRLAGPFVRIFQKAIQRRNDVAAVAAARALPQLSLLTR
jgi:hypothetical protein